MSMTDPIADFLSRIRNGIQTRKVTVDCPRSQLKLRIAEILRDEGFVDAVFALLEHLCVDAECEPRSPRYFFGFASWPIVEHVRRQLIAVGRAAWDERDDRIRTPSGQIVLAGREPVQGWPLDRAVIVCNTPPRSTA